MTEAKPSGLDAFQAPVVLDNGGYSIKAGFGGYSDPVSVLPNCLAKPRGERQWLIGDMLQDARDISCLSLRRPIDRGFVVSYEAQQEIWSRTFDKMKFSRMARLMSVLESKCLSGFAVNAA
mmetsp:Transcript_25514/g.60696  ORF Transcript_25514/g.60696 Transcript_25514/m.60696 type:complete len:121 (+) Transcript_25514:452-814(+)